MAIAVTGPVAPLVRMLLYLNIPDCLKWRLNGTERDKRRNRYIVA
jgi:hypothetical protein